MQPRRSLSLEDVTAARVAYEQGASYRELGQWYGVAHDTIARMLKAVGVVSRPVGWPHWKRPPQPAPEAPRTRPAVEIAPDVTGRLRIPLRTAEERRLRSWTSAERRAIEVEIAAGRVQRVRRGRSGLPERPSIAERQAANIAFWRALQEIKAAA
jgi:hypothetical protein